VGWGGGVAEGGWRVEGDTGGAAFCLKSRVPPSSHAVALALALRLARWYPVTFCRASPSGGSDFRAI
jgi:hypothetical protein